MADQTIDDLDDLYGPPSPKAESQIPVTESRAENAEVDAKAGADLSAIPGLGSPVQSLSVPSQQSAQQDATTEVSSDNHPRLPKLSSQDLPHDFSAQTLNPSEDVDKDHSEHEAREAHGNAYVPAQESENVIIKSENGVTGMDMDSMTDETGAAVRQENESMGIEASGSLADAQDPATDKVAVKIDPEFLQAAEVQKGDAEAEWQYDSSDAETSSSDSSTDTSSDEDSDEEEYELLDPATAAKMLMAEEGGEDEDGPASKASTNTQLRTKNEKPPQVVPKPDVTVTPEMKTTLLGAIEHIVDNYVLVKANVSGEYQVLEQGSVLCTDDRTVIGAVAETLGRVQEPLYSILFTSKQDIEDAGLKVGSEVFYVDIHSTFVFTQPLRNLKGTDASNLHDEEVGDEEMEFSDDEAEAAYKRAKKQARRGGRGGANAQLRNDYSAHASAQSQHISYDDDDNGDEMYTPLARPTNYQQMANGAPAGIEQEKPMMSSDRGRGRGRGGRGRGDRGAGDRGRGGRGGRGGADDGRQRRGASNSFPDHHNSRAPSTPSHSQAPYHTSASGTPAAWAPPPPPGWNGQQFQNMNASQQQAYQFATMFAQQQAAQQAQQAQQAHTWPQYAQAQHQQHVQSQQTPQMPFPPFPGQYAQGGSPNAFSNPAFFYNQHSQAQQPQQQQQQQQQTYPGTNQYQNAGQTSNQVDQATVQQQLDILRRLGGGQ